MPPNTKLDEGELGQIQMWRDLVVQGSDESSQTKCRWLQPGERLISTNNFVKHSEAKAILRKACASCHGMSGQLTAFDWSLGGVAITSTGTWIASYLKNRKNRLEDPNPKSCLTLLRTLSTPHFYLKAVALGSVAFSVVKQGIKIPHTSFLDMDGGLNSTAFAGSNETLGRLKNQVEGVDGPGFMPPGGTPGWFVGHYSGEDKNRLITYFGQRYSADLPKSCQATLETHNGTLSLMKLEAAFEACDKQQMALATEGQIEILYPAIESKLNQGSCIWSSSFSDDPSHPYISVNVSGAEDEAYHSSSIDRECHVLCIR